jgi:hypothetical protein
MTALCNKEYIRIETSTRTSQMLRCQYIKDHPSERHSWFAIAEQDAFDDAAAAQREDAIQAGDAEVKNILDRIDLGYYDSYIEAFLAGFHNRKRTIRNVRGFPRMERRRA